MKYMSLLTTALEEHISKLLPEKIPIVFDGWTLDGSSTHYVAMYARWWDKNSMREKERKKEREEREREEGKGEGEREGGSKSKK